MGIKMTAFPAPTKSASRAKTASAAFQRSLNAFTLEFTRQVQGYPAAQPWKSPPPRTGLRAGGRRTGTYGKGWVIRNRKADSVEVVNEVKYAVWVGGRTDGSGPKQTANMARRGWVSMTTARESALKKMRDQLRKDIRSTLS